MKYLCLALLILFSITLSVPLGSEAIDQQGDSSSEFPDTSVMSAPAAMNGTLMLDDWNFGRDGMVKLQGDWLIEWEEWGDPGLQEWEHLMATAAVPSTWGNLPSPRSNQGYATYRLRVILPKAWTDSSQTKLLAMYMPSVATAYTLWINGQKVLQVGEVGRSKEEMVAGNIPQTISFASGSERMDITIHVSNFVQRKGGLWAAPLLGTEKQVERYHNKRLVFNVTAAGSLIVMAMFHLALFFWRRTAKAPLYFVLLCLAVAVRILVTDQAAFAYFFPWIPWEWNTKMEYISAVIGSLFLLFYFLHMYRQSATFLRLAVFIALVGIAYSIFVMLFPALVYTQTMMYMIMYIAINFLLALTIALRSSLQKLDGAMFNLIGTGVFFLFVLNDFIHYIHVINSTDLTAVGVLFFLFVQSLNVTHRFARAYNHAEELSTELLRLNQSLDKQVEERTRKLELSNRQLRQANEELSRIHEERRRLFSDISHELGHPISSIQGYIRGMIDGVVPRGEAGYLQIVYEKTLYLQRVFRDLIELAQLESGQIQLDQKNVNLSLFIKEMVENYRWDIEEAGVDYLYDDGIPTNVYTAKVDPNRMEQVFANLLSNAKKFTPSGGRITIHTSILSERDGYIVVTIKDTGPGIPEEHLPHLFERFYQVRKGARQGNGLGLAIVKGIVELHGGFVGVESKIGEGSQFFFAIPVESISQ